ncbi:MAG: 2-dehydropantoate 2-reductase N-terminal domain-containing protein [Candidatus Rokuibacteriota bacterium]
MRVTVLGGGSGGYATAADLALAGHEVRLWRRAAAELAAVRQAGGLTLVATDRRDKAAVAVVAELGEAVGGADVIVVAVPATAHEDMARQLAPHLGEQQLVLVTPGTLGGFVMAREIIRAGGRLPQAFVETGTLPYRAGKTGPAEIRIAARAASLPIGVFPGSRSAALAPVRELFPAARRCVDVLDAALTDGGPVLHPALVLANLGAIDQGRDVDMTVSARRLGDAVDAERVAARAGWGYPPLGYEVVTGDDEIGSGRPMSLAHRYVVEDVALGLSLFESAARTVGAETAASSGLLLVFGTLLGRPLSGRGRALEHLGLGDLALREIRDLLHAGWSSRFWRRFVRSEGA